MVSDRQKWPGLCSLLAGESQRTVGDEVSTEGRYLISGLSGIGDEPIGPMICSHWGCRTQIALEL